MFNRLFVFCFLFGNFIFGDLLVRQQDEYLNLSLLKGSEEKQFFLEITKDETKSKKNLYTVFYDSINKVRKITRQYPTELAVSFYRNEKIFSIMESDEHDEKFTFLFNPTNQQIIEFQKQKDKNFHQIRYFYNEQNQITNSVYFINKIPYRNIQVEQKNNFIEKNIFQNGKLIKKSIHEPIISNKNKVYIFDSKNDLTDSIVQHWNKNRLMKSEINNLFYIDYYYTKAQNAKIKNDENIQAEQKDFKPKKKDSKSNINISNTNVFSGISNTFEEMKKLQNSVGNSLLEKSIEYVYKIPEANYLATVWSDKKGQHQKIIEYYYKDTSHFLCDKLLDIKKSFLKNKYLWDKEKSQIHIEPFNFYSIYPKIKIVKSKKNNSFIIEEEDFFIQKKSNFSNDLLLEEKVISKKNNSSVVYRYQYQNPLKTKKPLAIVSKDEQIVNKRSFYFYTYQKKINLSLLKDILFYLNNLEEDTNSLEKLINQNFKIIKNLSKINFLFNNQQDKTLLFKHEKSKTTITLKNKNAKIISQYIFYFYNEKVRIIRSRNGNNIFIIDLINDRKITIPSWEKSARYLKDFFKTPTSSFE